MISGAVRRVGVIVVGVLVLAGVVVASPASAAQGGPWPGFDGCDFNGLNSNTQHVAQTWESGSNCGNKTVMVQIRYQTLNGSIVYTNWVSDASVAVKSISASYTILTSYHRMCRTGTTTCTGTRALSA